MLDIQLAQKRLEYAFGLLKWTHQGPQNPNDADSAKSAINYVINQLEDYKTENREKFLNQLLIANSI